MAVTNKPKVPGAPGAPKAPRVKWLRYVLVLVLGFGIYHILSGPSGMLNLFKLRSINAEKEKELDSLGRRKAALQIEKQRLEKDSAYIEGIARKDLGMAKPEEKVFRYVPAKGSTKGAAKENRTGASKGP